jgi:hypothetical protein
MGTLAELQAKPDRLYPLLWLSNEGGSLEDNYKVDNIRLTMFGRVISGEEGQDDDASEIEVLSDMQLILLDFLNYFHQQHAQEYVVAKSASLEHFTERTNDRTAGYSCILELKQFYDWNKCQIPESGASISPSVDGLTLYDFCDQSVIDRLTPTQVACLEDEFGGGGAPATLTVNSATFTTVASGGTLDIAVHDTADANVGTVASTSEIEIGNSSNEVNGVDISEPTVAEGTHNQQIQNSASTPVGTAANPSVIGDSQAQVNGVNTETIAATVTHNQEIQDSAGGSVGTAANPSVISDNTINFNGADVDTVKAEETYAFLVKLDGSNSGTYNAGTNTVSVTSAACADATTQVNAVNVGTVASGGTYDQQIHDSAGADVGTSANPSVIADSTVRNNATPTWSDTVKAEDTLTLAQGKALDSDGVTTLLADYIPSASGFMFNCTLATTCSSVSLAISDLAPEFGDTITLTATPTNFVGAITYHFIVQDYLGNWSKITQVSDNTYDYTCPFAGTFDIHVICEDGSGNTASACESITVGTFGAKHTFTAGWSGVGMSDIVSDRLDSLNDIVSATYTASAPSASERPVAQINAVTDEASTFRAGDSDNRLQTTLTSIANNVMIAFVFDFTNNEDQGDFNTLTLIGGDGGATEGSRYIVSMRDNSTTRSIFFYLMNGSVSVDALITETATLGRNICVMKYDHDTTTLRVTFNGTTTTASNASGTLWAAAGDYQLLNSRSNGRAFAEPVHSIYIRNSATSISDAEQDAAYADLLLKFPNA